MKFDVNIFKKKVKTWMQQRPQATLEEFIDFCEEQIPTSQFAAYQWLLDQSVTWYGYIISQRDVMKTFDYDEEVA